MGSKCYLLLPEMENTFLLLKYHNQLRRQILSLSVVGKFI